jgi:hypothetical protein
MLTHPVFFNTKEKFMSTYNQMFKLSINDVDLIERALRGQIGHLSTTEALPQQGLALENHTKIVELMHVLGTLHNQKIWYGQIHRTGVPLG